MANNTASTSRSDNFLTTWIRSIRTGCKYLNSFENAMLDEQAFKSAEPHITTASASQNANQENNLPPKLVKVMKVRLAAEERAIYEQIRQQGQDLIDTFKEYGGDQTDYLVILAMLTRLRQCAVLPHLLRIPMEQDSEEQEEDPFVKLIMTQRMKQVTSYQGHVFQRLYVSSKFKRVIDDLEQLRRENWPMEKVVIVSCWNLALHILHEHLHLRGFQAAIITGKETYVERMENQRNFNSPNNQCQILLLSVHAAAVVGQELNLMGVNYLMFLEPHRNSELELQVQNRVFSYGPTTPVMVRRYVTMGTVEEKILEAEQNKIDVDAVENGWVSDLSQLFELFKRIFITSQRNNNTLNLPQFEIISDFFK